MWYDKRTTVINNDSNRVIRGDLLLLSIELIQSSFQLPLATACQFTGACEFKLVWRLFQ